MLSRVEIFMMNHDRNLPKETLASIRTKLENAKEAQWQRVNAIKFKESIIALILSLTIGPYGLDRFYIGDYLVGAAKALYTITVCIIAFCIAFQDNPDWVLLTILLVSELFLFVWYIFDIFAVQRQLKWKNHYLLLTALV